MKRITANRLLAAGCMMLAAAGAWAMPTKNELAQAQQLVQDLTAEDLRAMKAGTKQPGEVAAAQLALADEAETEAGKYLLLQGAFKLYARAADYDAAADALARMRKEIADLPPELVVEMVNGEMRRVTADKAPRVLAIFRDAQRTIRCRKDLEAAENAVKAKPGNATAQRRLAECHAGLGDWAKALEVFAQIGDETAKYELDPDSAKDFTLLKAANYWWEYPAKDAEPFKAHAAALYRKGLDDGSISGLRKTLAQKRVKQMEAVMLAERDGSAASGSGNGQPKTKTLDLGGGVTMEMIYVAPGSFMMGSEKEEGSSPVHKVTLTKGFWLGKYEVTQKQWTSVMGNNPSKRQGDDLPVDAVSWEKCQAFIKKLNKELGGDMARLPTEAEWEYACRAGTTGDFSGTGNLDDMGWYSKNSKRQTHPVGQKQANAWGFYDMHGNVWEWCNDWFDKYQKGEESNPVGPSSAEKRILRGGSFGSAREIYCFSSHRFCSDPSDEGPSHGILGFRLCMSADWNVQPRRGFSRGNGVPATSNDGVAEAPSAKVTTVPAAPVSVSNGKEISVKLATGVTLDFVPCPAGSFEMGCSGFDQSPEFKHKVTITRPFWIGKYQVTRRVWAVFDSREKNYKNITVAMLGGLDAAKSNDITYNDIARFCDWMNKRYKSKLPRGYVFRLPTEAEWEYALNANAEDPEDLYVKFKKGNRSNRHQIMVVKKDFRDKGADVPEWALPSMTVGTKKPNAWGIYDMLGNGSEFVLDTVAVSEARDKEDGKENRTLNQICIYEKEETDPLRIAENPKSKANGSIYALLRGSTDWHQVHDARWFWKSRVRISSHFKALTFRLVIGPDLLKERGIK